MSILILGKQFTKHEPQKVGGVIILFELFKKELKKEGIAFKVIDLNWRNYHFGLFAYPIILFKALINIPKYKHISFHGTANEFIFLSLFIVFFSKLFSKKVSLRKFAGNYHEIYESSNFIIKKTIEYSLKNADYIFFETKYLVDYFKKYNNHTYWFPNVREKQKFKTSDSFNYKFVFVGHIKQEKGINEILEVSNKLDNRYQIDIYGPLDDDYNEKYFLKHKANYRKVLKPEKIIETIMEYDVLILPSYREGYPGVIIEAFSVGLPVIATNLEGIKEIVDEKSGILIDKNNTLQLKKAIEQFDEQNYLEFSKSAKKRFDYFDSGIQTKKFLEHIGM